MKKLIVIVVVLTFSLHIKGQLSFFEKDSIPNQKRVIASSTGYGVFWAGSIIGLSHVWYKDAWGGGFKFFNDGDEWLQMDKYGHTYTANHITRNVYNTYRWSGLSKNKSLLLGAGFGVGYLATFEILDGFSEDWGFSWWDIAANGLGVAWFTWQELFWEEQRLKLKFSASPSPYAQYRPTVLGSSFSERLLKDYNGQTYWLNINPSQFLSKSNTFPKWLSLSVGYSINEKLHGFENMYISNGKTFNAYRQYLFSLDIDLERLPVNKPWLKTLFSVVNHIKIPLPTVEYSKNSFHFHAIYF